MEKFFILLILPLFLTSCRFYEVDPGKYYRSSQPNGRELKQAIVNGGIKSVINLRGTSADDWYTEEKAVTAHYGIPQIDIGMSAGRLPHRKDLIKLLDAFKSAPRPILLHCKAGVDRTGEASAIYEMLYMGKTKEEALKMLTPSFGHFENFKPAKIYFIRDVWVDEQWARDIYDPCVQDYKYYDKNNPECTGSARGAPVTEDSGET